WRTRAASRAGAALLPAAVVEGPRSVATWRDATPARLLAHVTAGRILERGGGSAAGAHAARGLAPRARVVDEPALPRGPPRALPLRRALQPLIGRQRLGGVRPGEQAVPALGVHRAAHDARVVAAARQ